MSERERGDRGYVNFRRAASIFVAFFATVGLQLRSVDEYDLCIYVEYLSIFYAPATVPVYFSHAKVLFMLLNICHAKFDHIRVRRALAKVAKARNVDPKDTIPVSEFEFNLILSCVPRDRNCLLYKFAFSLLLVCAWRRSNIAPDSAVAFNPRKHITRGDVQRRGGALVIQQKWAKTSQRASDAQVITVPATGGPSCVVELYSRLLQQTPTRSDSDPLLMFPDTRKVVTARHLAKIWERAVKSAGVPYHRHSLHCIRKTAASMVANMGATESQIMDLGLWRSAAYRRYVKSSGSAPLRATLATSIK